MARLILYLQH